MTKGERLVGAVALCALYLRGAPFARGVARRRWPLVVDALQAACPDIGGVASALRARGLYDESSCVSSAPLMDWALDVCTSDRALTFVDPGYPRGWMESLGAGAPPCVWSLGAVGAAPSVGVVGSRLLDPLDRSFAAGVGRLLMRTGRALVTGGAAGADSVALSAALECGGAGRCVVVLPFGLDHAPSLPGVCLLSACEPWAEFTTGQAMERNALIYSFGRRTVVVRARLREGGTWHGAADALRRRLGAVYVRARVGDPASRSLVALGAGGVTSVSGVAQALDAPLAPTQPALFGASVVRSPSVPYGAR